MHHDCKRNAMEFQEVFGFDPLLLPLYFGATSSGKIFCKEKFIRDCQGYFTNVRTNFKALGV
jgi:hypothetical protein